MAWDKHWLQIRIDIASIAASIAAIVSGDRLQTSSAINKADSFETITVTNAVAKVLTPATYLTSTKATISVAQNTVRVRWDGTAPTTSVGHLCEVGTILEMNGHDITHFQAISIGTDAILSVTYSSEV